MKVDKVQKVKRVEKVEQALKSSKDSRQFDFIFNQEQKKQDSSQQDMQKENSEEKKINEMEAAKKFEQIKRKMEGDNISQLYRIARMLEKNGTEEAIKYLDELAKKDKKDMKRAIKRYEETFITTDEETR